MIVTIIQYITLLIYAISNLKILFLRENANIYLAKQINYYDYTNVVDLSETGFKVAIGVEDYNTGLALDDPYFVRWEFSLVTQNGSKTNRLVLNHHRCTDEDYAMFWTPLVSQEFVIKNQFNKKKLYCID